MDQILTAETELHNGVRIPTIGYRIDKDNGTANYDMILRAVHAGFRHLDVACDGDTEKITGRAIRDCGVPRSELFLSLKLDNEDHGYDHAIRAFENSLKRLDTDYADLYLIDWPNPLKFRDTYEETAVDTWRALETLYKKGQARAIGLANYEARHIEFCLEKSEIAPMVNQARIYPGFPFEDNLNCANEHKIQTEGFLPPDHDRILNCKELSIFAEKYHATPRQICIRYLLEKNCIALCQGSTEEELKDAFNALNFSISKEDMKFMDAMKNYGPANINPDTCDF